MDTENPYESPSPTSTNVPPVSNLLRVTLTPCPALLTIGTILLADWIPTVGIVTSILKFLLATHFAVAIGVASAFVFPIFFARFHQVAVTALSVVVLLFVNIWILFEYSGVSPKFFR